MQLLLLIIRQAILPAWMQQQSPDKHHFYRRRFTKEHRAKRKTVRKLWLCAITIVLLYPALPVLIMVALPTTLLSLAILDETA